MPETHSYLKIKIMNTTTKMFLTNVALLFFVLNSNAQISENSNSELHNNALNIEFNTTNLAKEVFKDCPEYLTNELLNVYEETINRVTVIEVSAEQAENHILLSKVGLKNKCNASLSYDSNTTDISLFNPLKYFFNYSATEIVRYRIDGTNYLISISPKN